jgi:hypothetical protein
VGLSGNSSPDKPTPHIGDYFLGRYATGTVLALKSHVIPPPSAELAIVGVITRELPSTGLPTFLMPLAVIAPVAGFTAIFPTRADAAIETPTPKVLFMA